MSRQSGNSVRATRHRLLALVPVAASAVALAVGGAGPAQAAGPTVGTPTPTTSPAVRPGGRSSSDDNTDVDPTAAPDPYADERFEHLPEHCWVDPETGYVNTVLAEDAQNDSQFNLNDEDLVIQEDPLRHRVRVLLEAAGSTDQVTHPTRLVLSRVVQVPPAGAAFEYPWGDAGRNFRTQRLGDNVTNATTPWVSYKENQSFGAISEGQVTGPLTASWSFLPESFATLTGECGPTKEDPGVKAQTPSASMVATDRRFESVIRGLRNEVNRDPYSSKMPVWIGAHIAYAQLLTKEGRQQQAVDALNTATWGVERSLGVEPAKKLQEFADAVARAKIGEWPEPQTDLVGDYLGAAAEAGITPLKLPVDKSTDLSSGLQH